MRKILLSMAAISFAATAAPAAISINFDTVTTGASVDEHYNGGTDSASVAGPNLGVSFQSGDWLTNSGFGETSEPNLAYSNSGAGTVNVAAGFTASVSFTYGVFADSVFNIYSGLNGTGTLLSSTSLLTNDPANFDSITINFAGTAQSFGVTSGAAQFGFDDLVLGAAVPEPASWAMMIAGFGLAGAAMRRTRAASIRFA